MDEPSEDELALARANCAALIKRLFDFSLHMVRFTGKTRKKPTGLAAGFIVEKDGALFVLTAGHSIRKKGQWCWETSVTTDNAETLCIPLGPFTLLDHFPFSDGGKKTPRKIDFAWCQLDLEAIKQEVKARPLPKGQIISYEWYKGPLNVTPEKGECYTFAAPSGGDFEPLRILYLHRRTAIETCLLYEGTTRDGRYIFSLDGKHKGHAYYRGASGAPIAAPDGTVVSMLLGGHIKKNILYGANLARYMPLIGI